MLFENIDSVKILSVLDLAWCGVDSTAFPRPYHALSLRIKGDAVFTSGEKVSKVGSGDIIYVPEGLGYDLVAGDEKLFCIHFSAQGIPTDKIIKFTPTNSLVFEKLFSAAYDRFLHKKSGFNAGVLSDFYKIISKIQRQQSETKLLGAAGDITESVGYIHEHFTEPSLTVSKIAEASSLSESHFRLLFKKHFGISPLHYINNLRVEYAKELIESDYYKVYEIAAMSGFSDVKYFSTVIRKATGKSPVQLKIK